MSESPIDELARLREQRDLYKQLLDKALRCVDDAFQQYSGHDAILPDFLSLGSCKFQGVVKLAEEYKKQVTEIARLRESYATIRDAVLHNRHQLAEMEVDSDIINAVLGIIDDNFTEET